MYSSTSDLTRRFRKAALGRLPEDLTSSSASLTTAFRRSSASPSGLSPLQQGNLKKLVTPKLASVNIFLCCNPDDFILERRAVRTKVAKEILQNFEDSWDVEIKIVDRYKPAGHNFLSHEDRIKDIEHCKKTSMSVYFVALIGHKYWATNIPLSISASIFEVFLRSAYDKRFANWKLLEGCYEYDQNSVPAKYVLKKETMLATNEGGKGRLFNLHALLRRLAQFCFDQNLLSNVELKTFLISSFDEELQTSLFDKTVLDPGRCMCYIRTITGMERDMNITRVRNYVDVALGSANSLSSSYVSNEMLDLPAQEKINRIREKSIPDVVACTNGQLRVYTCSVTWLPQTGLQQETHKSYLDDFSHQFCDTVSKITAQNIDSIRQSASKSESLCHLLLAKNICESFKNTHPDIKVQLFDYICGLSRFPLILFGTGGTGKTFLLSSVADDVHTHIPNAENAISVVKFVGMTISSSYVPLLLDSICNYLENCFPHKKTVPGLWCTDISHLQKRLESLLACASRKMPILILIDSITDLVDFQSYTCLSDWLPCSLPEHVKIIVSVNSDHFTFKKIIAEAREKGFPVVGTRSLSQKEYINFIRTKLDECGRQITSGQYVYAMQATSTEKNSEYATGLAASVLSHAKRWKSSSEVSGNEVGYGEAGVIKKLYKLLQQLYGQHLVHRAIGFLTTAHYGITEQDLNGLLLGTDSVLKEALQSLKNRNDLQSQDDVHNAVANCLTLLLHDLSEFLYRKYIGGCHVYCWRRSIVKNALLTTFDASEVLNLNNCLVTYYVSYMKRKSQAPLKEPLKAVHICMELYSHNQIKESREIIGYVLPLSFSWLHTMLHSVGIVQLLCLLEHAYKVSKDRSILIVERALRLALPVIHRSLNSFAGELFSRLSYFASTFPAVKNLIMECVSQPRTVPSLLPAGIHAQAPGAPLRVSINEQQQISRGLIVYEKHLQMCLTYCCSRTLKMFDMCSGDVIREILFKEEIEWVKISTNLKFIVIFLPYHQNIFILDEVTCTCDHKLSLSGCFYKESESVPPRSVDAFLSDSLGVLWSRHYSSTVIVFSLSKGTIICTILCVEQIEDCRITEDERMVIALSLPQSIWFYNAKTGDNIECLQPVTFSGDSILHVFESLNHHLLTVHVSGIINVWKAHTDTLQHKLELDSRSTKQEIQPTVSATISFCRKKLAIIKPNEIDIWNLTDWKKNCGFVSEDKEEFCTAAFSNKAEYLCVTKFENPCLYVWHTESPTCIAVFYGHTYTISGICIPHFTSRQKKSMWVVTYENCQSIKVWNFENMSYIPTITTTGRPIESICCIEHHTVTTDGSDTATVWDTTTGGIKFELKHSSAVTHCCVSSCEVVTVDNGGYQYVWKTDTGNNLIKIKGPKVERLLLTPNQQMVVTMFKEPAESQPGVSCASRVWHLETGQVICSFDYHLANVQVTSKNTFLVGISNDGKLNAISLWMGMLAKVISSPGGNITFLHALSKRDEVITVDSNNHVCLWNIGLGTNIITLDMKTTIMRDICISDSGSVVTMMDPKQGFKALEMHSGKLRSVETRHIPILSQISSDGVFLFYISMKIIQAMDGWPQEAEYNLIIAKLTTGKVVTVYPLESTPTCMNILKSGKQVAIGVEEGRTIVFNFITKDMPTVPTTLHPKNLKRNKMDPKDKCDGIWHTFEPKYEAAPSDEMFGFRQRYSNGQNKQFSQTKHSGSSQTPKVSIHVQRKSAEAGKSVNLSRISSSNKVRVFM